MVAPLTAAPVRALARPELDGAHRWLEAAPPLPRRVAVGLSGGADSMALLLALATAGHEVMAWHVDHGWRAESAAEAAWLGSLVRSWGLAFRLARLASAPGANREAEAREARLRLFARWAREEGVDTVCLAHHRDDQAETVCLRLLQGAGVEGCAGMRPVRELAGLRIVRPLLGVPKADLVAALARAGAPWLEDASNRDTRLLRNRIRHRLFPSMRAAGAHPEALFVRLGARAARLAGELEARAASIPVTCGREGVHAPWPAWREAAAPVRAWVLQRMARCLLGEGRRLGRRHIEQVEAWLAAGARGGVDLTRCRLERAEGKQGGRLQLRPAGARLP